MTKSRSRAASTPAMLLASIALASCLAPDRIASAQTSDDDRAAATLAWRESFQSSPAATDIVTDAQFDAFAERLNLPPEIAERVRPRRVEGTIRYRLELTAGGKAVRVRLSNEANQQPLRIDNVSVGLAANGFAAMPDSLRQVTFGGAASVVIPGGAPFLSDPIRLDVPAGSELIVSIYSPEEIVLTGNGASPVAIADGDMTMQPELTAAKTMAARPLVSAVEVAAAPATRVIAALGDSITDGNRPVIGVLHAWPDRLAERLAESGSASRFGVVNAGISGNMLVRPPVAAEMGLPALARLERDLLRIEGLSHLIVLEGINDIGTSGASIFGERPMITAEELIAGYRQIIARAQQRGVKVIIGTITPFAGSPSHSSPEKERVRQAVNDWIRTSGEPDNIVDFDAAIRDPGKPERIDPRFDSGDHLHPNEEGQRAMGDAIPLDLFD